MRSLCLLARFAVRPPRRAYRTLQASTVSVEELAERARQAVLDPQRNTARLALDAGEPLLGLFNDVPKHQFRESDARAWALAGFTFVVNDAEHSGADLLYGREQNACLVRYGLAPVQRLPREALSAHGDALACGHRGTMRPYATSLEEAAAYLECVHFPAAGGGQPHARGAYPVRLGDGTPTFTPESLREAEAGRTLPLLQFETEEYLFDAGTRRAVLEVLAARQGAAFVGALDAATRCGDAARVLGATEALCAEAAELGVPVGGVVGGPTPADAEENVLRHLRWGMRLIATPTLASDLALHGSLSA
eukprot:CAMPEP_0119267268 /NCGR_PEP_ID=MMETSP1329-20130426/5476_1 /TAXON_ID=114041 /ORGANISM="Genus nov. species nov., Strain RCC1024" /LENGTH=306 /DNA_ID=CAMNT_0007267185 /DNA_START=143 /DNA_END=1059 /DNA_ORIENTATION=+